MIAGYCAVDLSFEITWKIIKKYQERNDMLRLIITALFLVVFFIFSIPMFGILWIIGKFNKPKKDILALRIVQWAFKVIRFLCGVKTTVIGYENIPKDEPVLFVGNHNSNFDTVIVYSMLPGLTGVVAKKEMEKIPLLHHWMKLLYCLFLDRKNIKEGLKTVLQGIEYIKNGISITIFPEGTRSRTGEMAPFKEGSLKFAEKTGCKIIPVVQNNTRQIMEAHSPFIRKTHTVLEFGEPIDVKSLDKEQKKFLGAYTQEIIQKIYDKNKALV